MPQFNDIPDNIKELIASHIKLYLENPEQAHWWDSSPVGVPGPVTTLLLTTKGRKSGKERHVPLLYVDADNSYLVIGSKGGNPTDPVWYLNLQETPDCEIRVGALRSRARARTLSGEERERAWQKITERHPVYLKYQSRAARQIPVIQIDPVAAEEAVMSDPIVIGANAFVSRWFIRPERREEFIRLFNQLWRADIEGLRKAVNFVFYGWGRNANEFVAIESWKDEAAVAALRQTEFFQQAVTGLLACCERPMEMQLFTGLDAPRDLFATYPAGPSTVHPQAGAIGAVFL